MRKVFCFVLVVGLVLSFNSIIPVNADGVYLEYIVTINKPETHLAHIEIIVRNNNSTKLIFHLKGAGPASSFYPNLDLISDFKASDLEGNTLKVKRIDMENWEVNTEGRTEFRLNYTSKQLVPYFRSKDEYFSYIGKNFAVTNYGTLLAKPKTKIHNISVSFNLPENWEIITPWEKENDKYEIENEELLDSYIALGPFQTYSRKLQYYELEIAIYGKTKYNSQDIIHNIENFAKYYQDFNKKNYDKILIIFAPRPMKSGGTAKSPTLFVNSMKCDWNCISHEFFHVVGLSVKELSKKEQWINEGVTDFCSHKSLVVAEIWEEDDFAKYLIEEWNEYQGWLNSEYNVPIVNAWESYLDTQDKNFYDQLYTKGALIVHILDIKIKKFTQEKKEFKHVVNCLNKNHVVEPYSNYDFMQCINSVTGYDFTPFFDAYVYGIEELPLKLEKEKLIIVKEKLPQLEKIPVDTDKDGLFDDEEVKFGTNPKRRDTDNDGLLDGKEIEIGTNPLNPDTDEDGLLDEKDPHPLEKEDDWRKRTREEADSQFSEGIKAFKNEEYDKASYFFILAKQKFEEIDSQEKIEKCENYLNQIEQKIKEQEETRERPEKERPQKPQEEKAGFKTITMILDFLILILIFRRKFQ